MKDLLHMIIGAILFAIIYFGICFYLDYKDFKAERNGKIINVQKWSKYYEQT